MLTVKTVGLNQTERYDICERDGVTQSIEGLVHTGGELN